jgi:hypothetical protein
LAAGATAAVVSHQKKNCGRRPKYPNISSDVATVPLSKRNTLRHLSAATGISTATLHRQLEKGIIRRHSSSLKPLLTECNKIARINFCFSMLEPSSVSTSPKFKEMFDIVYVDEKWFYLTRDRATFYLTADEEEPYRSCKSKKFIGKLMFLAAVSRPRFYGRNNCVFDGKIGIWPFVTSEPAKRSSINRQRGTAVTKPVVVDQRQYLDALLTKVLPAIRAKFSRSAPIYIQQDNARPHIKPDHEQFRACSQEDGYDIRLFCQPANSPDLNILDLGFFNAIQSIQHNEPSKKLG